MGLRLMAKKELDANWLVIDWGTTNFRAFAMSSQGVVLDKVELSLGILQVKEGEFSRELEKVLSGWLSEYKHLPVYMAGMVGSQQGWADVAYVPTPVDLHNLASAAYRFELPWGAPATIIPGVSHQSATGVYDVMRGEEVQLFGLVKLTDEDPLVAVLPGTHSKHAHFENGKLTRYATYMTGELFSVLSKHSILGRSLPEQTSSDDHQALLRGVRDGQTDQLTNALFLTRTHRLFKSISETEVLEYLSGMLIGNELRALNTNHIYLVGSKSLWAHYKLACEELAIRSTYMNGDDCFLAGMAELQQVMNNGN